jgi:hypothetical protein
MRTESFDSGTRSSSYLQNSDDLFQYATYFKGKRKAQDKPAWKNLAGVSHHKMCIITAMDEHDNILYRIGGLGNESTDKYMKYKKNLKNSDKIMSDS